MRLLVKDIWGMLKQTFSDFIDFKILRMSAALAYYTIFSLAPMLILILGLCNLFLAKEAVEGKLFIQIKSFVGQEAALQIQDVIKNASASGNNVLASVIGVVTLLLAATGIFTEIQDSINFIWRLKVKPKRGWLKLIVNRALSFSMIVSLGFVLLVSLVINALLNFFSQTLVEMFPQTAVYLAFVMNQLLTFIVISFLFGIIFKVLPDAKIMWRDVRAGAFTTALLFMVGKFAISYYLGKSKISSSYGAAGSIIIILTWVYYSSIILYLGAAFTRAYAQYRGRNIYPSDYAVWIQQVEMENHSSLQAQKIIE